MNYETQKLLEWLIKNNEEYIMALQNVSQQDNIYTAECCLQAVKQFLDNPKMLDTILAQQ
jgi:hypothetical protein